MKPLFQTLRGALARIAFVVCFAFISTRLAGLWGAPPPALVTVTDVLNLFLAFSLLAYLAGVEARSPKVRKLRAELRRKVALVDNFRSSYDALVRAHLTMTERYEIAVCELEQLRNTVDPGPSDADTVVLLTERERGVLATMIQERMAEQEAEEARQQAHDNAPQPAYPPLTGAQLDTLIGLVERGPLEDGSVPSKTARNELLESGHAVRVIVKGEDGYTAATYYGREAYKREFGEPGDNLWRAIQRRKEAREARNAQAAAA